VLSAIQHSNFRSSFERQSRQHVVLVHPLRDCSSQCSRSTLSKPRRLPSSSKCTISIFLSRSFPVQWAISFVCARHRRSCPWIASLIVSSLPSSADFKSRPETQGSSSSDLSFSSSHIGRHERWSLRSISLVCLVVLTFPQSSYRRIGLPCLHSFEHPYTLEFRKLGPIFSARECRRTASSQRTG